jgi:hypothetical protein
MAAEIGRSAHKTPTFQESLLVPLGYRVRSRRMVYWVYPDSDGLEVGWYLLRTLSRVDRAVMACGMKWVPALPLGAVGKGGYTNG